MSAFRSDLQPAGNGQFFQCLCQLPGVVRIHQVIRGCGEDCAGRESLRVFRNLIFTLRRFCLGASVKVHGILRIRLPDQHRFLNARFRINREAGLRLRQSKGRISHLCIPQADQVSAGRESTGNILVHLYMELSCLFPDQLQSSGKIFHVLFHKIVPGIHLVGQHKHMITQPVELIRHRPAFRQAPYVHESAAGHQENERTFIRFRIFRREPDNVYTSACLILIAFCFAVERIIPLTAVRRPVQAPEPVADLSVEDMLFLHLSQCLVPYIFLAQVPVPDCVLRDQPDLRIAQQFPQCVLFKSHCPSPPFFIFSHSCPVLF